MNTVIPNGHAPPEPAASGAALPVFEGSAGSTGSITGKAPKTRSESADAEPADVGFHESSERFQPRQESAVEWVPDGFRCRGDGAILYEVESDEWQWLCSPLGVVAATRNADGEAWGRLLLIRDRDGRWHEWAMPMAELAGSGESYRARLLAMGLELASGMKARNALHRLLTAAKPQARARCVASLGWHGDVFLLPDEVIGDAGAERMVLQTHALLQHNFRLAGTLRNWQDEIGSLAVGNSRLIFAISMALAAPLLRPLGIEGGGVHFRGGSSSGKTTSAEVAGSVCGGGTDGYKLTWRATDNAIETVAAIHNDGFAVLDEIGQVSAEALGPVAYMLANGQAKRRMTRDAVARAVPMWRLLFLSTGEVGLADKIAGGRGGARVMAGQQVRVLDLPADAGAGHGVFEALHGFPTGQALSDNLKAAVGRNYGHPLRGFLRRVIRETWQDGARAFLDGFVTETVPAGADGQVRRAAQRFAVIAVAGELGRRWGILPWPEGEAISAAKRLFGEWLAARGGSEPAEIEAGLSAVRHFLDLHGASRFVPWQEPDRVVQNRVGFARKTIKGMTHYVLPEAWRNELLRGHDAGLIAREMAKRGLLRATTDGKPQTKQRLPDGSERKVYVVLPTIFGGSAA